MTLEEKIGQLTQAEQNALENVSYKATGKLSHSRPRTMAQTPTTLVTRDYDPLFKYGFGLTFS